MNRFFGACARAQAHAFAWQAFGSKPLGFVHAEAVISFKQVCERLPHQVFLHMLLVVKRSHE